MVAPLVIDSHAIEAAAELGGDLALAVLDAGGAFQLSEKAARGDLTEFEALAHLPLASRR